MTPAVFSWDVISRSSSGWIWIFSGISFYPLNPQSQDIRIEDIAHALAHQCRFAGHTRTFYSIAQHSVLVSQLCRSEDALWGLLHDASEVYLQDVARPLKELDKFETYRDAERCLQRRIAERFGLGPEQPASVAAADDLMLAVEYRDLMAHSLDEQPIVSPPDVTVSITEAWPPHVAEQKFWARFDQLFNGT